MTLRITLIVDETEGEELVGVLAKGLGRGELGILNMRLDAVVDETASRIVKPAHSAQVEHRRDDGLDSLIKRLPGKTGRPKGAKTKTPKHLRKERVTDVPPAARVLHDFIVKNGPSNWIQLRAELVRVGFAGSSINTAMKRLTTQHHDVYKTPNHQWAIRARATA